MTDTAEKQQAEARVVRKDWARKDHSGADARLLIPPREGLRSLNVALACAMITGEALRQTGGFPPRG